MYSLRGDCNVVVVVAAGGATVAAAIQFSSPRARWKQTKPKQSKHFSDSLAHVVRERCHPGIYPISCWKTLPSSPRIVSGVRDPFYFSDGDFLNFKKYNGSLYQ